MGPNRKVENIMQSVGVRSSSQKGLRIISIIEIVFSIIVIIIGIVGLMGGAAIGAADPSSVADVTAQTGLTQAEVGGIAAGGSLIIILAGALSIVGSIFGLRASNDNQKIMPAWVLSIVSLAFACVNIVTTAVQGQLAGNIGSLAASLGLSLCVFILCNNIKAEAGK